MPLVFVNYRTGDGELAATLIGRELARRFGSTEVFRASTSIAPGEDFERAILRAVRRSAVLLALIGPRWLGAHGPDGQRRIDDPADWTRREILEAFACDVVVLPILLGGAPRLTAEQLPEPLRPLSTRQYLRFDHRTDDSDLARIVDRVAANMPGGAGPRTGPYGPDRTDGPPVHNTNVARDSARVGQQNGISFGGVHFDPWPDGHR